MKATEQGDGIVTRQLLNMLLATIGDRDPDFVIGDPNNPYLIRWWLRRDRENGCEYLHKVMRDDDDRALHDHPWDSTSIILSGKLREVLPGPVAGGKHDSRILTPGSITSRKATDAHRLEIVQGPVWTLFITGPMVRDWGFHCPNGWVPWWEFVASDNPGVPGRGCGEGLR